MSHEQKAGEATSIADGETRRVLIVGEPGGFDIGPTAPYDLFGREMPVIEIRHEENRFVDMRIIGDLPEYHGAGPAPRRAPVASNAPAHVEDGLSRASRRRMAKAAKKSAT